MHKLPLIKPTEFSATLTKRIQLTHDVWEFHYEIDPNASFTYNAGQFVMVQFEHENKRIQRAYSISSQASSNKFELCVKIIPNGIATNYLLNKQIGESLNFKGPYGMFFVAPNNTADLLLISTGTGIAPMKGIIDELLKNNDQRNIHLLFGVRHPEDVFYQEHFAELSKKHPNLHINITCSRPTTEWTGNKGRVTDHFSNYNFSDPNLHIYICGGNQMVIDTRKFALEQGMDKKHIHIENFG